MLKILEQNVDVFAGSDAAKQNNFAFGTQFFCQPAGIARQRLAVARIVFVNIDSSEFA